LILGFTGEANNMEYVGNMHKEKYDIHTWFDEVVVGRVKQSAS